MKWTTGLGDCFARRILRGAVACVALAFLFAGCGERSGTTNPSASPTADRKIRVTTTVTMVGDLVREVGGDRVEVQGLMGPGVDPHLYKATASDVTKLQNADVIFYSGLLLEGKMQDIFSKLARAKKFVYPVTEAIPQDKLLEPPEFAGHYDPHVWFEVPLWKMCVETVVKGLSEYRFSEQSALRATRRRSETQDG